MKLKICSSDEYYILGMLELLQSLSLTHVKCTGEILIVDLSFPGKYSEVNLKNTCYVIYLSDYKFAFNALNIRHDDLEVYYLKRTLSLDECYSLISSLIIKVMRRDCYWQGVKKTKYKFHDAALTFREREVYLLALKCMNYNEISSELQLNIKTISGYKVKASSKLMIYNHAQFAELARQVAKVSELHDLYKRRQLKYHRSSANICRAISVSIK